MFQSVHVWCALISLRLSVVMSSPVDELDKLIHSFSSCLRGEILLIIYVPLFHICWILKSIHFFLQGKHET